MSYNVEKLDHYRIRYRAYNHISVVAVQTDNTTTASIIAPETSVIFGRSNDSSGDTYAVYWTDGVITQLPTTGAAASAVYGVNDANIKYGYSNNRAAIWNSSDVVTNVSGGVVSRILSSSDDNSIKVGLYRSGGDNKAASWDASNAVTVLAVPAGWTYTANAAVSRNGSNIVATHVTTQSDGYYYSGGTPTALPTYSTGDNSVVNAVNDSNVKVGASFISSGSGYYPCYWSSSNVITMLSTTVKGEAKFITNSGYIAGQFITVDPTYGDLNTPCYWVSGVRTDLPMLDDGILPYQSGVAYWISEDGNIKVGACETNDGFKPCYWDASDQVYQLPLLTGGDTGYAYSQG